MSKIKTPVYNKKCNCNKIPLGIKPDGNKQSKLKIHLLVKETMIKLEIGDDISVNIKNDASEVSLKEIQELSNSSIGSKSFLKTWYSNLLILADSDEFMYMSDDDFLDIVSKIQLGKYSEDYTEEIEVDGNKYILEASDGKPRLNVKAIMMIEEYINNDPLNWLKYAIAILYKKEGEDNKTHFNKKEVEKRAKLFDVELNGEVCFPLMWYVNQKMTNNFNKLKEIFDAEG